MHKLLERQLKKAAAGTSDGRPDLDCVIALVDAAYGDVDQERRRLDHAVEQMQSEIEALARRLQVEAASRFNTVMDNVGEAVVVIGEEGRIESFNRAAERTFGYTANEVLGQNVTILMTEADVAHHDASLRRYLETGVGAIIGKGREVIGRRKDGEHFPAELAVGESFNRGRRTFVGVIRDISARKQTERELRDSESRFRDLAGSASDWFWETDDKHRLSFVSERIGSVLGVKPSEILGYTHFDIGLDDQPDLARRHREDLEARRPFRDLVFHVGTFGGADDRTIRLSGIPVFAADGAFAGFRGVGADITREVAAERRASLARQQMADAIDSITDAIAVFGPDDTLVICNRSFRQMFAVAADVIVPGVPFARILDALGERGVFETGGQSFATWRKKRLAEHARPTGRPFIGHMVDGRWLHCREHRTNEGGVVSVCTDITDIKHREAELEELRRRTELILDSAGEGIVGLDTQGRVTFANRMSGSLLGYTPETMVGRCFHALIAPTCEDDGLPCIDPGSAILAAYRSAVPREVSDETFCRSDGTSLPIDYFVAPIFEDDSVTGAVVAFRDATLRIQYERTLADNQRELERLVAERTRELWQEVEERARTEDALRVSQARLRGITENLFEGVLVVDAEGILLFSNRSAERLLSYSYDTGKMDRLRLDDVLQLERNHRPTPFADSPFRTVALSGNTLRDDDAVFHTPSGRPLSVAYACSPLGEEGDVRAAILSFRDISALKQAQREAFQASRLASVGQLAAGIAHEINTPIQYIGDNLRFLADAYHGVAPVLEAARSLADQAAHRAELIGAAAHFEDVAESSDLPYLLEEIPKAVEQSLNGVGQVSRIVLSMKEFSHPGTAGKTNADINHSLENTLTVCRNAWKHAATMKLHLDPNLPPVPCHIGEINQVFLNLIVNAAQAIEAEHNGVGHIVVTSRVEDGFAVVEVRDNGPGVPEALRDKIFDPFFTTKDVGKGTGQGLAICRDVVVGKHGGHLELGDNEGGGAIFSVWLPLDRQNETIADALGEG